MAFVVLANWFEHPASSVLDRDIEIPDRNDEPATLSAEERGPAEIEALAPSADDSSQCPSRRCWPGAASPRSSRYGALPHPRRGLPCALAPTEGVKPYWVTARGYNWGYVLFDHETGGERDVALEPAGRLDVRIRGDIDAYLSQGVEAYLRVYVHGTQNLVTKSSGLAPFQGFTGIAVGTYEVKAELGSIDGNPLVLGET